MTQDLDISPATQTVYYTAAFTTFSFQPLFAVIAQCLSTYTCVHQRYSAMLGILIAGFMYVVISISQPNFKSLFLWTIALNVGLAFCNAIIDGVAVEISNDIKHRDTDCDANPCDVILLSDSMDSNADFQALKSQMIPFQSAASIQSLCYFIRSTGSLSSAAMLIGLDSVGNYTVIALTGSIYIGMLPFLWFLFPKPAVESVGDRASNSSVKAMHCSVREEWTKCLGVLVQIWKGILFVFLLNLPPTFNDTFFTFLYSRIMFTAQQYRVFKFMALLGSAIGGLLYFLCFAPRIRNVRRLKWIFVSMQLLSCGLAGFLIPITNLSDSFVNDASVRGVFGIPFGYYLSIALLLDSMTSSLALMPQITLAAEMSPRRLETAVFATFMGLSHLGQLVSASISTALLTWMEVKAGHWDNLTHFVIICSASGLIPLFGLFLVEEHNQSAPRTSLSIENRGWKRNSNLDITGELPVHSQTGCVPISSQLQTVSDTGYSVNICRESRIVRDH